MQGWLGQMHVNFRLHRHVLGNACLHADDLGSCPWNRRRIRDVGRILLLRLLLEHDGHKPHADDVLRSWLYPFRLRGV